MRLSTAPIRRSRGDSVEFDLSADSDAFEDLPDGVSLPHGVRATGRAYNTGDGFAVTGSASATVRLSCDRCLEDYEVELIADLSYDYYREGSSVEEPLRDERSEGERLDSLMFRGDTIDILEQVREALLLLIPHKKICREQCQGICPICGCNRNLESCDCDTTVLDPRLADLAELLED